MTIAGGMELLAYHHSRRVLPVHIDHRLVAVVPASIGRACWLRRRRRGRFCERVRVKPSGSPSEL